VSAAAALLADLVRIESINPALVAGGSGEGDVARFVAAWLERAGLEVGLYDVSRGRPNVVGVARGTGGGRSLLLNAHTDTVGVEGMERPLDPVIHHGRLHGRGSYDMKGGLAAAMQAAAAVVPAGLRGDVIVAAVVDEELASAGTESLVGRVQADAAIVTEPTELRVAIAHKGFVGWEIETAGRAAHGSRPDLGVDAIARMGPVLVRVDGLAATLAHAPAHPLLGPGSVHASIIEGGQEFSSYPERCLLKGERRTVPGETTKLVERELRELAGEADARVVISRDPFEVAPEEPLVELLCRHAEEGEPVGVPFWADSALLAAAGIPTAVFGPRGEGAHAREEWVDLDSVERCARVLEAVARELCA
jgi:acetylornithine deacetylase